MRRYEYSRLTERTLQGLTFASAPFSSLLAADLISFHFGFLFILNVSQSTYKDKIQQYAALQLVLTAFCVSNIVCLQIDAEQPPNRSPTHPEPILLTNVFIVSPRLAQTTI